MISENTLTISENKISKNKRGRPSILDPDKKRILEELFPKTRTIRGLQNNFYMGRVLYLIKGDEKFQWLFDREKGVVRQTILAELGRIKEVEDLLSMARQICQLKPTSRDGVRMIRDWRLKRDSEINPLPLA